MNAPHPLVRQLQGLREAAGLSQYEPSRRAEVDGCTVRNWETGRYGPTVHVLEKLGAIFGMRLVFVPEALVKELELIPTRPSEPVYGPLTLAEQVDNWRTLAEAIGAVDDVGQVAS